MTKLLTMTAAAFLLSAGIASASVTQTNLLVNGDVHGTAASGEIVNLTVQFTNTGVSTFQSAWVEIQGSGFPGECVDVLDENQIGTHSVNVNVNTLGTTEGQWTVSVKPFGINRVTTGSQGTDTDCTNSQGNAKLYSNQLKITNPISTGDTANNTGGGGVNGNGNGTGGTGVNNGNTGGTGGSGSTGGSGVSSSTLSQLQSQLDQLTKLFAGLQTIVAGMAPDAICAQKPSDTSALQNFFVGQGLMTSAEVATGPGIYGPKTTRANSAFMLMHKCRS